MNLEKKIELAIWLCEYNPNYWINDALFKMDSEKGS